MKKPHDSRRYRVAVLGGGLTGLTCAYKLAQSTIPPIDVDIYEAQKHLGGIVTTTTAHGFTFEEGPASMQLKYPAVRQLIYDDLKLGDRIVEKTETDSYVVKDGKVVKIGKGIGGFVKSEALSWKGKVRVLGEMFVGKGKGRESVGEFFRRRFGREVVENVVDPMVGGIYAGKVGELDVGFALPAVWEREKESRSVILGMLLGKKGGKELRMSINYRGGMKVLVERLEDEVKNSGRGNVLKGRRVGRVGWDEKRAVWKVNGKKGYDVVVNAVPSHRLGDISWNVPKIQELCAYLVKKIVYAPVNILTLGFRGEQIGKRFVGRGILVPSKEKRDILGIMFNDPAESKEHVNDAIYSVYMGGTRRPDIANLNEKDTLRTACMEMENLLGIKGKPMFHRFQRWGKGIPQFTLGYEEAHEKIDHVEEALAGKIIFAGTYRDGVGVPNAVHSGMKAAEKVLESFNEPPLNRV